MKTIYFVRHAKAKRNQKLNVIDFERNLKDSGRKDAHMMGKRLRDKSENAELMISSPANRALETSHIFAKELGYPIQNILIKNEIYEATIDNIIDIINDVEEKHSSIMLFGHNPTFNELASTFIEGFIKNIPTSGIVCIDFGDVTWKSISPNTKGELKFFDYPKNNPITDKEEKKIAIFELEKKITEKLEEDLKELEIERISVFDKPIKKASKRLASEIYKAREKGLLN